MIRDVPQMPLLLQENFTIKLLELLRQGDIDAAILADPFHDQGLVTRALYDEPFIVAVPKAHPWASRDRIRSDELRDQTMLLLGSGHCFRDQVLEVCPELARFSQASAGIQKTFEGSSLETILHMVASGVGITVLPRSARPELRDDPLLRYLLFEEPPPLRRVSLVWRKNYPRPAAIEALRGAILASGMPGVMMLPDEPALAH
jgi:LysR family hydrogen peroxide-inducible transcriptional activator